MTTEPPYNDENKESDSTLGKGFGSARPVLFGPDNFFFKANPETREIWIVHDVPVDLDLQEAIFDEAQGLLQFITTSGESFEMGTTLPENIRAPAAKAKRVTLIYIPGDDIENVIAVPLRQATEK